MFPARMVEDKLNDGFIICKINGEQTHIEYTPSVHDQHINCYPVTTGSKSKGQEGGPKIPAPRETDITGEKKVVFV